MQKTALVNFIGHVGGFRFFESRRAREPLVVLYHGVTTNTHQSGTENYRGKQVPLEVFRKQIDWLSRHFSIVPLAEIEQLVIERRHPTKPLCAVTFDDGYRNNYTNAFPVLRECGIPATLFVTTGFVDARTPLWVDRLEFAINHTPGSVEDRRARDSKERARLKTVPAEARRAALDEIVRATGSELGRELDRHPDYAPLSWDEIREMARSGIAIGAHTVTHPILSREASDVQGREIVESAVRIRVEVGECTHFAYPNGQPGDWDDASVSAIKEAGFAAAWTTEMRRVRPAREHNVFALPRIALDAAWRDGRFVSLATDLLPTVKHFL